MRSSNARRGTDSVVKMVIRVGKDEVPLGECHPAQARNLVKKEYASWDDGKLLILGRPTFLRMLGDEKEHWTLSYERPDVSDSELDRRKAWFKEFMTQAVKAVIPSSDMKPRHFPVSSAVPQNWADVKQRAQDCAEWAEKKESEKPVDLPAEDLAQLWEVVPDVSRFFGCAPNAFQMKASESPVVLIEEQDPEVLDVEKRERVQMSPTHKIPHVVLSNEIVTVAPKLVDTNGPWPGWSSEEELKSLSDLWVTDKPDPELASEEDLESLSSLWMGDKSIGGHIATEEEYQEIIAEINSQPGRTLPAQETVVDDDRVIGFNLKANSPNVFSFPGESREFFAFYEKQKIAQSEDDDSGNVKKIHFNVKPAFEGPTREDFDSELIGLDEDEEKK